MLARHQSVDWNIARILWRRGLDTLEIAKRLGVDEGEVYNRLNWIKAKEPEARKA